jgi:glucuronosyltransferase
MTFYQRVINFAVETAMSVFGKGFISPSNMEDLYKIYLPDAPSISEVEKNISLIFTNSHFSMTYPRPLLPNVIEVSEYEFMMNNLQFYGRYAVQ